MNQTIDTGQSVPDASPIIKCPNCTEKIFRRIRGEYVVRNKVVKTNGNNTVAICPKCNNEVRIPYTMIE